MADLMPTIIIDAIQQTPLPFSLPTERETMATGAYSLKGLKHKGLDDLVGCLKNGQQERFERKLSGGQGLSYFALVVESLLAKYVRDLQKRFKAVVRMEQP